MHGSSAAARNDKLHVDERRYANTIKLTADGTLLMGIWNLLKVVINTFSDMGEQMRNGEVPYLFAVFGVTLVMAVFFVIGISFRFIIWKGARKESADGKKRNAYIICAAALLAYGVYAFALFIQKAVSGSVEASEITKLVFDLTSFIILCELLYCAIKLRKVRAELAGSEEAV